MEQRQFFHLGSNPICKTKFEQIKDDNSQDSIKPDGGFWAADWNARDKIYYNPWIEYILFRASYLLYHKYKYNCISPYKQPCSLITLCDEAKIFNLDSSEKYYELLKKYPYDNNRFSYEQLSKEYAGIYIDYNKICDSKEIGTIILKKIESFSINSLILFNLECIEYYQPGIVNIDEDEIEDQVYEIDITKQRIRILK